jgi:hypothetical protein
MGRGVECVERAVESPDHLGLVNDLRGPFSEDVGAHESAPAVAQELGNPGLLAVYHGAAHVPIVEPVDS